MLNFKMVWTSLFCFTVLLKHNCNMIISITATCWLRWEIARITRLQQKRLSSSCVKLLPGSFFSLFLSLRRYRNASSDRWPRCCQSITRRGAAVRAPPRRAEDAHCRPTSEAQPARSHLSKRGCSSTITRETCSHSQSRPYL